MKQHNHDNSSVFELDHGLALAEIKLEHSIKEQNSVLNSFDTENFPQYLTDAKVYRERQLLSLKMLKTAK